MTAEILTINIFALISIWPSIFWHWYVGQNCENYLCPP